MQFTHPVEKDFSLQSFQILARIFILDDLQKIRLRPGDRNAFALGEVAELDGIQLGNGIGI